MRYMTKFTYVLPVKWNVADIAKYNEHTTTSIYSS